MERRKPQQLSERLGATPTVCPTHSLSTVRAIPELRFLSEDSENVGAGEWGALIRKEVGKLPMPHSIAEGSSQNPQTISEFVPPKGHFPSIGVLATLKHLQEKMDHLQNTMEDMPLKVAEIMKQSWLTKGPDYLKMSEQTVGAASGRECNLKGFPPTLFHGNRAELNLCLQQVFSDVQSQNRIKCTTPVNNDGCKKANQCIQPGITDGQGEQENQYIQPVFGDWQCQQQSRDERPSFFDEQSLEESVCSQPVFTEVQDPDQSIKLEPLSPKEKEQEENQGQRQVLCLGRGQVPSYKVDQWCSSGEGPAEPSISLASSTLPAHEAALIDSLPRRNENPKTPLFKATPGSVCEMPALMERIKQETSVEDFQGSEERAWINKESALSFTDSRDLELRTLVRHLEEEEGSAVGKARSATEKLVQATPCSENENGPITKTKNLKIKLRRKTIPRKESNPTDGEGLAEKLLSKSQLPWTCTECEESFTDWSSFLKHQNNHNRTHKCMYCQASFILHSQLMRHLRFHEKDKFACAVRDQHFTNRSSPAIHKRYSVGERFYKCRECDKSFPSRLHLGQHQKIHTGGNLHESTKQGKPYLPVHQKSHQCTVCKKSFTRKYGLCLHQRTHSGEKPYECTACDKRFTRPSYLRQHQRSHAAEGPYQCRARERRFSEMEHLQTPKIHSMEKPYMCTECGKHFTRATNLRIHHRIHSGEKPYECTECGKLFIRTAQLRLHQRIHSEVKPYGCKECGKHFTQLSSLRTHQRLHTDELPSI